MKTLRIEDMEQLEGGQLTQKDCYYRGKATTYLLIASAVIRRPEPFWAAVAIVTTSGDCF